MSDNGIALLNIRENLESKDQIFLISNAIKSGDIDPTKAGVVLKRIGKISEEILKDKEVKKAIEDETLKHINGSKDKIFGAEISYCPVHTFYKFDNCGHTELDSLYKIQEKIKDRIKEIEDELKLIVPKEKKGASFGITSDNKDLVITQTWEINPVPSGEVVTVRPPIKGQQMGLKYMKL